MLFGGMLLGQVIRLCRTDDNRFGVGSGGSGDGLLSHFFVDESLGYQSIAYAIPRITDMTLGGTYQHMNGNHRVDGVDSKQIWKRCSTMVPELRHTYGRLNHATREYDLRTDSQVSVTNRVGLRPYRGTGEASLRVNHEHIVVKTGRPVLVIHNYGHGGSGITLHWGCAADVVHWVKQAIGITLPSPVTPTSLLSRL